MYINTRNEKRQWELMAKVLTKTVATVLERAMMYKVVFQMVLLYRSESWVLTEEMLKVMEGLHHQVAWRIEGMSDW